MMIFDGHLDLAMNALDWNRDLRQSLDAIRARENGASDKPDRGRGTVCFSEMRRGTIGLCVATQIARHVKPPNPLPGWHSPEQAWAATQGQLAWYRAMEEAGELVQVRDGAQLERQLDRWSGVSASNASAARSQPIGYVLSLEGADSLVTVGHLERAFEQGLRAVGLSHYGPGTYAAGTDGSGGIERRGFELLREMDRLGMILDVTHLTDAGFWEALDYFQGPVWASHCNCRALVPHHRQLTDEQIRALIERGGVIGVAFDAWMMIPGWERGRTLPDRVGLRLAKAVDHVDHVCQIAGNSRHAAIGSDLDGGFGREQCPLDLESIADLQRIPELLTSRGYKEEDTQFVAHGNLVRFLRDAWRVKS
jgi:membrane dipeptidase